MSALSESPVIMGCSLAEALLGSAVPFKESWIRINIPFPFVNRTGELSDAYKNAQQNLNQLKKSGKKILGVTANPADIPAEVALAADGDAFFHAYYKACFFVSRELRDLVDIWQIGALPEGIDSAPPLSVSATARFVKTGGMAIKKAIENARIGLNITVGSSDGTMNSFFEIYKDQTTVFDFVGIDIVADVNGSFKEDQLHQTSVKISEKFKKPIMVHIYSKPESGQL
jgi:hypothetical protein